jgi:hypothetical protein
VRDPDELQGEGTDRDTVARGHRPETGAVLQAMLLELGLHERQREPGAIHGPVDMRQHIGDRPDVVLVAVRQHQRLDLAAPGLEVRQIRHDQVHTGQVAVREHASGIDDDGRVPTRDGHHVEAELAQAAQRHNVDRWRARSVHRRSRTEHAQNPSQRGTREGTDTTANSGAGKA